MNENLREFLPYLRPRSAELTPFSITVLVLLCLGLAALMTLYYLRHRRHVQELRARFEKLGLQKGLSGPQIQTLFGIGRRRKMNNPLQLLNSVHVFDRLLGSVTEQLSSQPDHPLFAEVGEIRSSLEFNALPTDQALRTTRQLPPGLTMMVWTYTNDEAGGVPWLVTRRDEWGIECAPLLKDNHSLDSLAVGGEVSVRFWREGDTEYHFTSEVLEHDPASHVAVLRHAARIGRLQLRDFFRLDINFDIALQPLPGGAAGEEDSECVPGSNSAAASESYYADSEDDTTTTEEAGSNCPTPGFAGVGPVPGEVLDISGGGMRVLLHGDDPHAFLMRIPDDFNGPFPLGGLVCRVTGRDEETQGSILQLKFIDIPSSLEREMVRKIYQNQALLKSETPAAGTGTRAEPTRLRLPTSPACPGRRRHTRTPAADCPGQLPLPGGHRRRSLARAAPRRRTRSPTPCRHHNQFG